VSKLIEVNDSKIENLISFERRLNEIDPEGQYHIPIIIELSRKISQNIIN